MKKFLITSDNSKYEVQKSYNTIINKEFGPASVSDPGTAAFRNKEQMLK